MAIKRRKLKIDLDEIVIAFETPRASDGASGVDWFLDLETGETVMVAEDLDEGADVDSDPDRYAMIPTTAPREEYKRMVGFAEDVHDDDVREKLFIALDGKGAFGRFRHVLHDHPALKDLWFAQLREARAERAIRWLRSLQIEPDIEQPPAPTEEQLAARVGASANPKPKAASSRAGAQGLPYVGLLEMLLLGGAQGQEVVEGRAVRCIHTKSEAQARWVFKNVARDLCRFHGVDWRNRYIKDTNRFALAEAEVNIDGTRVELSMPAGRRLRQAFGQ